MADTPERPPSTVKLGRHTWSLVADDTGRTADQGDRGATYAQRLELVVDGALPGSLIRETITHELLHALWETAELGTEELPDEQVERIVAHLAPRLLDLLEHNPKLVAYLTSS